MLRLRCVAALGRQPPRVSTGNRIPMQAVVKHVGCRSRVRQFITAFAGVLIILMILTVCTDRKRPMQSPLPSFRACLPTAVQHADALPAEGRSSPAARAALQRGSHLLPVLHGGPLRQKTWCAGPSFW
jgi:hypothetical protein